MKALKGKKRKAKILAIALSSIIILFMSLFFVLKNIPVSNTEEKDKVNQPSYSSESPYMNENSETPIKMIDDLEVNNSSTNESSGKNYLLIGSDTREGSNSSLSSDDVEGQRSDTVMLVHVSKDKKNTEVISIPRDVMVSIPECLLSDGTRTAYQESAIFNSAFSSGDTLKTSIECTKNTVELNTGLIINGYASVDFSGLEAIVDSLGGIEVDVPERMVSSKANLDVYPGKQTLDGSAALAYARARTMEVGSGDGSDLSRIERQQQVLDGIKDKLTSVDAILHPIRTYNTIQEIRENVYLSDELNNILSSSDLALSLSSSDVKYSTIPTEPYTYDYNRLMFTEESYSKFKELKEDIY